jgi:hypothetical protein
VAGSDVGSCTYDPSHHIPELGQRGDDSSKLSVARDPRDVLPEEDRRTVDGDGSEILGPEVTGICLSQPLTGR